MDRHAQVLLESASRLDNQAGTAGTFVRLAERVVQAPGRESVREAFRQVKQVAEAPHNRETAEALNRFLLGLFVCVGKAQVAEFCATSQSKQDDEDSRTLEELLRELNALVGLTEVKRKVGDLIAYQKVQQARANAGLRLKKGTLHLAFTGNPGTGKTTVARIVGRIYKRIGLLSKGHFIEASRTDLIAGYQGQTALKVKHMVERAKGGVLFIDEAYSITENDHSDAYGRECLTELTKALEDYREDLVVIVAGYTAPMQRFFDSNPGLRSRFNTFIEFPDYSSKELEDILVGMCRDNDYTLKPEALARLRTELRSAVSNKDETFANGRLVRNLYENLIMNQARRVATVEHPTLDDLRNIVVEDCQDAMPKDGDSASVRPHVRHAHLFIKKRQHKRRSVAVPSDSTI